MASTSNNIFVQLWKDKFVRTVIKIMLTALTIFVLFFVGKAILGYNVKFLGNETRPERPIADTVYKYIQPTADSATNKPIAINPTLTNSVKDLKKQNDIKKIEQNNKTDKNEVNENNGVNMGTIGGSGNKVENNIYSERQFSIEDGKNLISNIKKVQKEQGITENCIFIENDAKNGKFASDLMTYLRNNGYTIKDYSLAAFVPFNGVIIISKDGCITIKIGNI